MGTLSHRFRGSSESFSGLFFRANHDDERYAWQRVGRRAKRAKAWDIGVQGKLTMPHMFIGAELGKSISFGIDHELSRASAEYYNGVFFNIKGATHPGVLIGKYADEAAKAIVEWLEGL